MKLKSPWPFSLYPLYRGDWRCFFAGIKASAPDMKNSADTYFDKYNVQDIQVYSTIGLTKMM